MHALRALAVTAPLLFGSGPLVNIASGDWELVVNGGPQHACAKDRSVCEEAIRAIERGWWAPDWRGSALRCEPAPDCFSRCSDFIVGFNAPPECGR